MFVGCVVVVFVCLFSCLGLIGCFVVCVSPPSPGSYGKAAPGLCVCVLLCVFVFLFVCLFGCLFVLFGWLCVCLFVGCLVGWLVGLLICVLVWLLVWLWVRLVGWWLVLWFVWFVCVVFVACLV